MRGYAILIAGTGQRHGRRIMFFQRYLQDAGFRVETYVVGVSPFHTFWWLVRNINKIRISKLPVFLVYCGHGSPVGWGHANSSTLSYRVIALALAMIRNPLLIINDTCYGWSFVSHIEKRHRKSSTGFIAPWDGKSVSYGGACRDALMSWPDSQRPEDIISRHFFCDETGEHEAPKQPLRWGAELDHFFFPKVAEETPGFPENRDDIQEQNARMILGDDIVFPKEIAEVCGLFYTEADLNRFADTMPSKETLRWCRANGYAVVAGPPKPLRFFELHLRNFKHFYFPEISQKYQSDLSRRWSQTGLHPRSRIFSNGDKIMSRWLAIRKEPVPNSEEKTWNDQLRLLSKHERVPNIAELSWFIVIFNRVRGTRFFGREYVRTSSTVLDDADGICISNYGCGICVASFRDDGCYSSGVGVAASRLLSVH